MDCRGKKETMDSKKQVKNEHVWLVRAQNYLKCLVCGRTVKPEACSWEEDDGGRIYCQDCRAEEESCGCSD
jgi:hypothetical protein